MVGFGFRLKQLRQARSITQKELAKRLGLTKSVISAYETDIRTPSFDTLLHIAAFFNVTTDYLLGVDHDMTLDISKLTEKDKEIILTLLERLKENGSISS